MKSAYGIVCKTFYLVSKINPLLIYFCEILPNYLNKENKTKKSYQAQVNFVDFIAFGPG